MTSIIRYKDPISFYQKVKDYLNLHEVENNLIVGLAKNMAENKREFDGGELYYVLTDAERIVGVALRTNVDTALLVSKMPEEVISILVKKIKSDKVHLIGINGEIETVKKFVGRFGVACKIHLHQGLFYADSIIEPMVQGNVHHLKIEDGPEFKIALNFLRGFMADCFDDDSLEKADKYLRRTIRSGEVYLWQDCSGNFTSMAAKTREGDKGAAISLVYTEPTHRGKGHAKGVCARLTNDIFKSGKSIAYLHTDLKNPISNKIYQEIGFKKIGEMMHYDFVYN